jgi:hypothetical protein
MPLSLPNLDDRTFDDLVTEVRDLIPAYAPEWTDHNPSDPGITLVELFAYIAEMLIYRLNRVTDANKLTYLKLLNEPNWQPEPGKSINQEIRETISKLRYEERAITLDDFERLAMTETVPGVLRAYCPGALVDKHKCIVTVVVLSDDALTLNLNEIKNKLQERCLLTTHVEVREPSRYKLKGVITLKLFPDVKENTISQAAQQALHNYFNPFSGGQNGIGWPLGRNIYLSELYSLLDKLQGVDYIESIQINEDQESRKIIESEVFIGININPDELIDIEMSIMSKRGDQ